jgi:hypothetical protein
LIHAVADIADATRKEWRSEEGKLSTMISTRMTVRICELLADGFSLSEASEVAIFHSLMHLAVQTLKEHLLNKLFKSIWQLK